MTIPNLRNQKVFVREIRSSLADVIEEYLVMMDRLGIGEEGKNLLTVLGALQASLQEYYKKGLGDEETAMLYYGIGDRIVEALVNEELNNRGYKGPDN